MNKQERLIKKQSSYSIESATTPTGSQPALGPPNATKEQNYTAAFGTAPLSKAESAASSLYDKTLATQESGDKEALVPVMSRRELKDKLQTLEDKYGIPSDEFYRRWRAGEAPDFPEALRWVLLFELFDQRYLL